MSEVGENRRVVVEYEHERQVRTGLQGTSRPINVNSQTIEELVEFAGGEAINELAHCGAIVEGPVPYGLALVPYKLLEQFCENGVPEIPDSAGAIDAAIDSFWPGEYRFPGRRNNVPVTEEVMTQTRERLRRVLVGMVPSTKPVDAWTGALRSLVGQEIMPWQWQQYADAHSRQIESGDDYTLDEMSFRGLTNFDFNERFGVFREVIGRHESFLFAKVEDDYFAPAISRLRMPIGPYGRELAERLLLVSKFMSQWDVQDYWLRNNVGMLDQDLIRNHTTRASGYDAPNEPDSFVQGIQEADQQAMPGTVSLLASSRIAGFDKDQGGELLEWLIRGDMIDEVAVRARQSLIASVALYGIFIPDIVDKRRDGRPKLSSRGIDALQALQEISDNDGAQQIKAHQKVVAEYQRAYSLWAEQGSVGDLPKSPRDLVRTWSACPYAGLDRSGVIPQPGAISQRSPAFLAVFQCIRPHANNQDRASRGLGQIRPNIKGLSEEMVVAKFMSQTAVVRRELSGVQ